MEGWVGVRRAVLPVFVRLSVKTLSQPKPQKKFRFFPPLCADQFETSTSPPRAYPGHLIVDRA